VLVRVVGTEEEWHAAVEDLSPANDETQPDNSFLFHLSEATLLSNTLLRAEQSQPYTYTGNILTSVNPCKPMPELYSKELMQKYVGRRIGTSGNAPHLYAIAEEAYGKLLITGTSQGMVVSGVSGAGKTEANKHLMQYLCWRANQEEMRATKSNALIEGKRLSSRLLDDQLNELSVRILQSNAIFESFCNACTTNNHNSSRFGKYTRINFEAGGALVGASIEGYLLEKHRLVSQCAGERSFHVLYQIIAAERSAQQSEIVAAPNEAELELEASSDNQVANIGNASRTALTASDFHYLNQSGRFNIDGVNDDAEMRNTLDSLTSFGVTSDTWSELRRMLLGLLHLGNVTFTDLPELDGASADGSMVSESGQFALAACASMWGLTSNASEALTTRRVVSSRGSSITIGLPPRRAVASRDGLAKHIYQHLFQWLIARVNGVLNVRSSRALRGSIGLLDAYGFELLHSNGYDQLLINLTNENLQQLFLQSVLQAEQQLYEKEGIEWVPITLRDNAATIALLQGRPKGVLGMLDEECRLLKGTDAKFADNVKAALQAAGHEQSHVTTAGLVQKVAHGVGARQEATRLKIKELFNSGQPHFTVEHFAGEVVYEAAGWLEKNNDDLHYDLRKMISSCSLSFFSQLFPPLPESSPKTGSINSPTISTVFTTSLEALLSELRSSRLHFIRTLKPNDDLIPGAPHAGLVLDQLRFSGMLEAVSVITKGYPGRISFVEIHRRFQGKLPLSVMRMTPGDFVLALIDAVGVKADYKVGKSRLFFRANGADFLKELQYADTEELLPLLLDKLLKWWVRQRLTSLVLGRRGRILARMRRAEVEAEKERLRLECEERIRLAELEQERAEAEQARLLAEEKARREAAAEAARLEKEEAERAAAEELERREREELALAEAEQRRRCGAATRLQSLQRMKPLWRVYTRKRKAAVRLQSATRRIRIQMPLIQLLADVHMLRVGTCFVKFNDFGLPKDRLLWVSPDLRKLHWAKPKSTPTYDVTEHRTLSLADISKIDDQLRFGLIKKIVESIKGFESKETGITALKPKNCISLVTAARTLDIQAPSRQLKMEWVHALRYLQGFKQLPGSLSSMEVRRALHEKLEDRQLVQELVERKKSELLTSFLSSFSMKTMIRSAGSRKQSLEPNAAAPSSSQPLQDASSAARRGSQTHPTSDSRAHQALSAIPQSPRADSSLLPKE